MRKTGIALMIALTIATGVIGKEKKQKPWTEWSRKEAQKILEDSPWGQTQVQTDTSEMFFNTGTTSSTRSARGGVNQEVQTRFRICFLSAKPVRQAFARLVELSQNNANPKLTESLRAFAEKRSDQWIVVAVSFDSQDRRFLSDAMQAFNSTNTGSIQNSTYLETKGGRRLFLQQYMPPIQDQMGAKFVFPRTVNGEPFITPESIELRFYSEFTLLKGLTLNMRFKLADMMYDGILEY